MIQLAKAPGLNLKPTGLNLKSRVLKGGKGTTMNGTLINAKNWGSLFLCYKMGISLYVGLGVAQTSREKAVYGAVSQR